MDSETWISDASDTLMKILTMLQNQTTWWKEYSLIVSKVKEIQNRIFREIDDWNYCHQLAQVGWPLPNPLNDLQPICNHLARILSIIFQQTHQQMIRYNGQESLVTQIKVLYDQSKRMLGDFLKRCLVIEKQPSPVIVKGTQFNASLRLLVDNKQLFSSYAQDTPKVSCSLLLDQEGNSTNENSPTMQNNKKLFEYDGNVLKVTLDKLKLVSLPKKLLKNTKRTGSGTSSELVRVPQQKSRVLFQTEVRIEAETFLVEAFSVPVVVITHTGLQQVEAEATIFWDNAFGAQNRQPFDEPDQVPFPKFGEALNNRWEKWNELELSENQLLFLAAKLFPGGKITNNSKIEDLQNFMVTKQMFTKTKLHGHPFSFWEWFYETMKFVRDYLKTEWRDGLIEGFITENDAEQSLQPNDVAKGTFRLRFSESLLGGVSVAYKTECGECKSIEPFPKSDLDAIPLSKLLGQLVELRFLYPSIPKEKVFMELPSPGVDKTRYPVKKRMRMEIDEGTSVASPSQSSSSVDGFAIPDVSTASDGSFSPILNLESDPVLSQANVQYSAPDDWFDRYAFHNDVFD